MTLFRANFDYESELFWGKQDPWAVDMLEHLFFFCSDKKDTLYTTKNYPKDYLHFIKNAIGYMPRTSSIGEPENWWGRLDNQPNEKKLNSKVTSFEVGNRLKINHSKSRLIVSIEELEDFLESEKDIFLRPPYERSGRVSFRLNDKEVFEKNKQKLIKILNSQPLLGDVFFEDKKWDLGTCMRQNGGQFEVQYQIKNLNDSKGVFRGAVLLTELIEAEELSKIGEAYYSLGARNFIQVDSFAYGEGINWLCEVNYRKTMGYIVHKLNRLCSLDSKVGFLMTPKSWMKELISHSQLMTLIEDLEGVFPLSPVDNPLYCWLVSAETREEIHSKTKDLWSLVAKKPEGFPEVYNKIFPEPCSPEINTPI